jgi:hypothetical protein
LLDNLGGAKPGNRHNGKKGWEADDARWRRWDESRKALSPKRIMLQRHAGLFEIFVSWSTPLAPISTSSSPLFTGTLGVHEQEQPLNKMWINVWFSAVVTNMAVAVVFAPNEFKVNLREPRME